MANVWAKKNGDWSDTTVWNTGALPTSADDVYANNFNVNVNQNITVNSLRNTVGVGIAAGGSYTFNTGNIIANNSGDIISSNATLINITATSGMVTINAPSAIIQASGSSTNQIKYIGNCNVNLTVNKITNAGQYSIIFLKATGTVTINADVIATTIGSSDGMINLNSGSPTVIINGEVKGGSNCVAVKMGDGILTVNGNVTGGSGATSGIVFWGTILNVTGNIAGNIGSGVSISSGTMNVTGTISGSNSNGVGGVVISGTASLNHIGTAQASTSSSAIVCNSATTSIVTCTGPFLKNGYIVAIASQTLRINFNSNSYFQFKKSNGDDIDYVSTVEGYNYPLASDVRYGVEYKSGLAIGTCHVPTPDNVRKNIPVDNTVGTSDNVNAEDILEAIQNSSLPIAERLRNVATVESTGAQVAGYG